MAVILNIETSTLPRSSVALTKLRIASSFDLRDDGTRAAMSICLLFNDFTSTVIFLPGSSATAFPNPVIEYNMVAELYLPPLPALTLTEWCQIIFFTKLQFSQENQVTLSYF